MSASPAIRFLNGDGTDHKGRTVFDYLKFDDVDWWHRHDIVQWAFPTVTQSKFNPNAPSLNTEDVSNLKLVGKFRVEELLVNYLRSLGISYDIEHERFQTQYAFAQSWIEPSSHHYLRFTRILESLGCLELNLLRDAFAHFVVFDLPMWYGDHIPSKTVAYWVAAWQNKLELLPE